MTISVRHMFERRLGLFPIRFLPDGQMVEDTFLADYPHRWQGNRNLAGCALRHRAGRLFLSYQVYGARSLEIRSLNNGVPYLFTVDSVNSAGVTAGSK